MMEEFPTTGALVLLGIGLLSTVMSQLWYAGRLQRSRSEPLRLHPATALVVGPALLLAVGGLYLSQFYVFAGLLAFPLLPAALVALYVIFFGPPLWLQPPWYRRGEFDASAPAYAARRKRERQGRISLR